MKKKEIGWIKKKIESIEMLNFLMVQKFNVIWGMRIF